MKIHYLKCWPPYFQQMEAGIKKFELTKNDRDFKVNDIVALEAYDANTESYTGERLNARITYILSDAEDFGLMPGYCILGLKLL